MSDLKACIVCFATKRKLYKIETGRLRDDFFALSGLQVIDGKEMPQYLCVECAAHVRRFSKFRERCKRAHYTLQELLKNSNEVTTSTLEMINAYEIGISSTLSFSAVVPVFRCGQAPAVDVITDSDIKDMDLSEDFNENQSILTDSCNFSFDDEYVLNGSDIEKELSKTDNVNDENLSEKNGSVAQAAIKRPGRVQCEICMLYFPSNAKLFCHMKMLHLFKYSCTICSHVCHSWREARKHYKWHNDTLKCPHCPREFKKSTSLAAHLQSKHPSMSICCECGDSFADDHKLEEHRNMAHKRQQFVLEAAYKTRLGSPIKHKTNLSVLQSLEKLETTPSSLMSGDKDWFTECGELDESLFDDAPASNSKQSVSKNTNPEKMFMCEVCGHTTKQLVNLTQHMHSHSAENMYPCPHCDRRFSTLRSRDRHVVIHTGEKRYECPHCQKRFSQSYSLKLHVQTVHLKIPYEPWKKRNRNIRKRVPKEGSIAAQSNSTTLDAVRILGGEQPVQNITDVACTQENVTYAY